MTKLPIAKTACIIFVFCTVTAIVAPAQTVTTLASFDGTNGAYPYSSLVQGFDGNFYGTTQGGGAHCSGSPFCGGVVFKVSPQGELTALYSFCAQSNCTDGEELEAGLVLGTGGNFYGTTTAGGAHGNGTVFRVTAAGKLTTLHSFCSHCADADGYGPEWLTLAADGNFYGIAGGGAYGNGEIFKMTPEGALTIFYSFEGGAPGPNSQLVEGTDGNFYGTTGTTPSIDQFPNTAGTVFKITPQGALTTLQSLSNGPAAGLIQGADGNFYGTTFSGGGSGGPIDEGVYWCNWAAVDGTGEGTGCGTVFEISPEGSYNTIYNFLGYDPFYGLYFNENPAATLVQATDGNFYGTTLMGGGTCFSDGTVQGCGTIFGVGPTQNLMYPFCSQTVCPNVQPSAYPSLYGQLLQATNGNFYGTAGYGGAGTGRSSGPDDGMVYSMSLGLAPFVSFVRGFGSIGQSVQILGQGFTGSTAVSFNGTPATFTVKSDTYVTATVPVGATNGFVTVAEPGGTLTSNKVFRVTPWISSFSPTSGPTGATVVITGNTFTGATGVSFNGTAASFTVESDTSLSATVPAGAISGLVSVTTAGGTMNSNKAFHVEPQIFSVSQSSGPVGTTLIVTGESFTKTYAVTFGAPKATFTVDSDTQLTVTVPPGAETTKFAVLTSGGTAYSPDCFVVTP
jgi:uncharacterized repeat protein (TIGR03803 family)